MIFSQPTTFSIDRKLKSLSFTTKTSISSQIKQQLQKIVDISSFSHPQISFHLLSPPRKPIIKIKSPKSKLSFPSTKSSIKTNTSFNNQEVSSVSEFVLPSYDNQILDNRDWVMKVVSQLGLDRKLLYDAMGLVEKYLKLNGKQTYSFKIVSMAMLSIICKLEKHNHTTIEEFLHLIDYQISKEQFINLEITILQTLQYKLATITLYDRLMYHIIQFQNYLKQKKTSSIPIIDLLSQDHFDSFIILCKMLDTILLSGIEDNYSLDSIIYILLKMVLMEVYKQKQTKMFEKVYQNYWKNRYVSVEVYRLRRNIGQILESFMGGKNEVPSDAKELIHKQTYFSELKGIAKQICQSASQQFKNC